MAAGSACLLLTGATTGRDRSQAFARFRDDPDCYVLILSTHGNNAGLTLTAANHLFLLDVCMKRAVEAQLMNRVHRIGQTRPVTITRYVCGDTVEERLLAWRTRVHAATEAAQSLTRRPSADMRAGNGPTPVCEDEDDMDDEEASGLVAAGTEDGMQSAHGPTASTDAHIAGQMRLHDFAELFGIGATELADLY